MEQALEWLAVNWIAALVAIAVGSLVGWLLLRRENKSLADKLKDAEPRIDRPKRRPGP